MNAAKVALAIAEAERFLIRADAVRRSKASQFGTETHYMYCPKESGAMKRASMDLTRALAELRKP